MLPLFPKSEARVCSSSLHPIISDTLVTGLPCVALVRWTLVHISWTKFRVHIYRLWYSWEQKAYPNNAFRWWGDICSRKGLKTIKYSPKDGFVDRKFSKIILKHCDISIWTSSITRKLSIGFSFSYFVFTPKILQSDNHQLEQKLSQTFAPSGHHWWQ